MLVDAFGLALLNGKRMPSFLLPGATCGMDFTRGQYWANGNTRLENLLSCTRAQTVPSYARTKAGVFIPFAANTPRITDQGLLVEEARTNGNRNNSNTGVVTGSPGTLPTNWSVANAGTLTQTIVGTGTEDGLPYIDLRFNGTTSTTQLSIFFESATQIVAANGEAWSASFFVKLVGGSFTNVSGAIMSLVERTAAGASVSAHDNPITIATSGTLGGARQAYSFTFNGGGTVARTNSRIAVNFSSGVAVDFTLRIAAPQQELGAFSTSPILTTTAAITRAADVISLTGAAATAALAAKAARFETNLGVGAPATVAAALWASSVTVLGFFASTTTISMRNEAAATTTGTLGSGSYVGLVRSALGFDASSITVRANGGTLATQANAWTAPTAPIYLANRSAGDRALNGYMQSLFLGNTKGMFDQFTA